MRHASSSVLILSPPQLSILPPKEILTTHLSVGDVNHPSLPQVPYSPLPALHEAEEDQGTVNPSPLRLPLRISNENTNSWHPHPAAHWRLHTLGWLEYYLLHGTVYYVYQTNKVTNKINLRSERSLAMLSWH